jgi:hypothetical protein
MWQSSLELDVGGATATNVIGFHFETRNCDQHPAAGQIINEISDALPSGSRGDALARFGRNNLLPGLNESTGLHIYGLGRTRAGEGSLSENQSRCVVQRWYRSTGQCNSR